MRPTIFLILEIIMGSRKIHHVSSRLPWPIVLGLIVFNFNLKYPDLF